VVLIFHSSQGRHTSEGASTTPTSPMARLPSHVTVGDHTQAANVAGNGAIMPMLAAGQAGVEKQDEWAHFDPGAVYSNIELHKPPANMAGNGLSMSAAGQEGVEKLDEEAYYSNIEVIQSHLQVYI